MVDMNLKVVRMNIPEGSNLILGQSHFIKTAEDIYEAKATADTAVQRAEFHRAYEIMAGLTQKYKIAEKQFEEFTKKLKDIDDIATPHQP